MPTRIPLLLALVAALAGIPGGIARCSADGRQIGGVDYRSLSDWARPHGLKVSRAPTSREVVVTGPAARVTLLVDASRVEFNGTAVWLSHPVILADNQVQVATQDLQGVLSPLLKPPRLPPGKRIRTICLDPGHGGKDPGHRSGPRLEKTYTLALAQEVRTRLMDAGFNVILTRRADDYPELPERTAIARRSKADLFVSLHFNSAPDASSDASGVEVYAMTPEGARSTNISRDAGSLKAWSGNEFDAENLVLAYSLQRSLLQRLTGAEDRGVRRARLMVLRLAEMPAVLVEAGFMSSASDARWIVSETGRKKLAAGIVDGIQAYRRLVERPAPDNPQRSTSSTSSTSSVRPGSAKN